MRRVSSLLSVPAAIIVAGFGHVQARTVVIGSDPCAAPADMEPYAPPAEVAADPAADPQLDEQVLVLKDVELGSGLVGRFILDAQTGLPYGMEEAAREASDCQQ